MGTTYTKAQVKNLQTKVFAAMTAKGAVQVKAYLKENAITKLQEIDPNIKPSDVSQTKAFNSHQAPVDRIVEVDAYKELFTIEYDNDRI